MKINSPAEDRIIVDLSEQDLLGLNITYEDMDYSTIETRRVIWTVLDEAGKALGREFDPSRRMIIEASPKRDGGCTLSFTMLDSKRAVGVQKQFLKKQEKNILCEFENADMLMKAAECLESLNAVTNSSLYELGGKYRLLLSGNGDIPKIKQSCSEFGTSESCSELVCCFTKEHWKELVADNAIGKILNR
ncbi:MAG: adaptor protein MecA [Clostridia bacterium]|nr:adaptor protein MecA [Clostridia bacterium]